MWSQRRTIEAYLLNEGGYIKGDQKTYDKAKAIDMATLISFIAQTQPKTWQRYQNVYGERAEKQLYTIFQQNVADFGLIHVLRKGVKDHGIELRFAYFQPASHKNEELVEKYQQNILKSFQSFAISMKTVQIYMLLLPGHYWRA